MNSVGVATGGGAGMALAHCIQHGYTSVDLNEADPKRFPGEFNSVEALSARVPEVLGKHYEITYPGRQWSSGRHLRSAPLERRWRTEEAQFGQFFSWERPLYFGEPGAPTLTFGTPSWQDAVEREVRAAHENAALFDLSTFGKIDVMGSDAQTFLNRVCANQMNRPVGRAIYTAMLNERGGIESDLTAVRLGQDHYRLFVATTAVKRDLAWLRRHIGTGEQVRLSDRSADYAVIALMGPKAMEIAAGIGAGSLNALTYFASGEAEIAGYPVRAVRLSYVGEAGWEITCDAQHAEAVYDAMRRCGGEPAGLYAQTSMRIEKKFLAYGHELDTDISPLEAGLEFAVDWNTDFIGKAALQDKKQQGVTSRIVSIVLADKGANPFGNEPVLMGGDIVGKTTSAAFGFRIGAPVALADIDQPLAREDGMAVEVDIAGRLFSGRVVDGPVFDPQGSRMRAIS
jgi:4-methylaminobutanoate oxidase (formaldehyde-forming)